MASFMAEYEVIVVGSGAGGGMAAHVLTEAGIKVLLLEAGRDYDPVSETPMFHQNHEAPLRETSTSEKILVTLMPQWTGAGRCRRAVLEGPDSRFMWWRARMWGDAPTTGAGGAAHRC